MKAEMKAIKILIAAMALIPMRKASATIWLDDAFRTFHTQMCITNVSQDAFLNLLMRKAMVWEDYYLGGRTNSSDQTFNEWYLSVVSALVPDGICRDDTNMWTLVKGDVASFASGDSAVRDDTNCWFAVAQEVGRIRAGFRTEQDWEALERIGQCEREVMPDGVVLVSITNSISEYMAYRRKVFAMKEDQSRLERLAHNMVRAFKYFECSQTFKNLSLPERNAIVSNLVETARMSELEVSALGFTNIDEQTGEP